MPLFCGQLGSASALCLSPHGVQNQCAARHRSAAYRRHALPGVHATPAHWRRRTHGTSTHFASSSPGTCCSDTHHLHPPLASLTPVCHPVCTGCRATDNRRVFRQFPVHIEFLRIQFNLAQQLLLSCTSIDKKQDQHACSTPPPPRLLARPPRGTHVRSPRRFGSSRLAGASH